MILDPSSAIHLKPWLVRTLEPICDAEPGALADYILALLKHNVSEPEMRKELDVQLQEFLEKECVTFIDSLFNVLRSKSYLPYSDVAPQPSSSSQAETGIPIPLELITPSEPSDQSRGRKRNYDNDERDGRPPAKGPRINADGQFSRYGNGRGGQDSRSTGGWQTMNGFGGGDAEMLGQMANMAAQMGMPGFNPGNGRMYKPPEQKRGICRDYHNKGYCARGATCKYSHGDDAVIPGMFPGVPMPFMLPGFPPFPFPGIPGGAYDPNESRMDMQPTSSGELPVIQDLTPADPLAQGMSQAQQSAGEGMQQQPMDVDNGPSFNGDGQRPTRPLRGRGRGRGGFGGDAQNARPQRRDGKTLVVEKIPEDKLVREQVTEWFQRFGSVTNVAVDRSQAKALVSFSNHEEAYAAWKSEEAVFGNRFVKLFWHRPIEGQGQAGAKALAASAPIVAKITSKDTPAPSIPTSRSKSTSMDTGALAAQQTLLEQQIAEQKSLMASLSTATPDEKKDIMARLRKLGDEMKRPSVSAGTSQSSSAASAPSKEAQQKELLDKELDMHTTDGAGEDSAEALKAKLEKLKAEAASLGITDAGPESSTYHMQGGYRPYRGRARGFRGYRGGARGGPPRASMKLDNRPKKLLVKASSEGNSSSIRAWFEAAGQVDSFETSESGDMVIAFKSRAAAEQALAKGSNIPEVGQIVLSWYSGSTTTPKTQSRDEIMAPPISESNPNDDEEFREASPIPQDEDPSVSRWGDDDGEDRM